MSTLRVWWTCGLDGKVGLAWGGVAGVEQEEREEGQGYEPEGGVVGGGVVGLLHLVVDGDR